MKIHDYLRRSAAKDKTFVLIGNIVIFIWILVFYMYNRDVLKDIYAYVTLFAVGLSGITSAYSFVELCRRVLGR